MTMVPYILFLPDGNLKTLVRYAYNKPPLGALQLDSFNYYYFSGGMDNRLSSLTDNAHDLGFEDVAYRTDSTIAMYQYDPTGNTTKDLVAGQDSIEWNLYNKVTKVEEKLVLSIGDRSVPLDFTFADFDVPIVNEKITF